MRHDDATQPGTATEGPSVSSAPRSGSGGAGGGPAQARPSWLGRYRIVERIGSGGMGVVYAAWDTSLRRHVAIKLLHPGAQRRRPEALRLEARALAAVEHPNVVPVLDVGVDAGRLYLAMARVHGVPMSQWLRRERPARSRVLAVFEAAGRGLGAVHAAGLAHRDFKPDNVLIGPGDVTHVVDFGLARAAAEPEDAPSTADTLSTPHSRRVTVAGTWAYMAPEQRMGLPPDAQADQFSFCVALCEALYGFRPDVDPYGVRPPRLPRRLGVPEYLRSALIRGLSSDPRRRHPDLSALLRALRPRRRLRFAVIAGIAVAALTTVAGAQARTRPFAPLAPASAEAPPPGLLASAEAALSTGDRERGRRLLSAHHTHAAAQRDFDAALRTATERVLSAADIDDASHWLRVVEAHWPRIDTPTPYTIAHRELARATVARMRHDPESAMTHYDAGLSALAPVMAAPSFLAAALLNGRGIVLRDTGHAADAGEAFEAASDTLERAIGPASPFLASPATNLGFVAWDAGRLGEAQRQLSRAWRLRHDALGPDNPRTAQSAAALARLLIQGGDVAAAAAVVETLGAGVAPGGRVDAPPGPGAREAVAWSPTQRALACLANAELAAAQGDWAAAQRRFHRTLVELSEAAGAAADLADVEVPALAGLATVERRLGHRRAAAARAERVRTIVAALTVSRPRLVRYVIGLKPSPPG
ncbi:MAG: serine/threonine-protein kinase [Myxococcota bacterium]